MSKSRDYEDKLQLIQNMVNNIDLMTTLFYEIKTGTPIGKTITILLNLYYQVGLDGMLLNDIPISKIAELAEISESELLESLKFLEQQGIIFYKPINKLEN